MRETDKANRALALAVCLTLAAPAGAVEPLSLTVEEALEAAAARSEEVAAARASLRRAQAERLQARSEWYPQIAGSLSYERTLATEFEVLSGASGLPPGLSDLPFGRENTWRLGLSASQLLYAGGRRLARGRLAEAAEEAASVEVGSTRAQAVLDVAQAYWDAQLADRLALIAEDTLRQAERTLARTQASREQGSAPEFDVLRARVTLDNQKAVVVQRRVENVLARERLRQLLELPPDRPLALATPLGGEKVAVEGLTALARRAAGLPDGDGAERAPVLQSREQVRASEAAAALARSQRLPQVSLSTQLGPVAYELFPVPDDFRNNWTVGVFLQVPLFTGLRLTGQVRAAEADRDAARARLQLVEELARLDARSAREQLDAARAALEASAGVVEQAEQAYAIAEVRYAEGVSTQLELADARLLLEQAQVNRARAARDLQVAAVRLALLPALPLAAPGAATGATIAAQAPGISAGANAAVEAAPSQTAPAGAGGSATGARPGAAPTGGGSP